MHLLRADVDLHYIRDFLGHVQIETTEVYARADAEMKRKALKPQISIFQPNPRQVGRKTKVCYLGCNRYDDETKILSKDIWARTAETQPFFAFLSIIQNFSLGRVVISR